MVIPIYRPFLPQKSLSYAHEALDSTWISSQGKYVNLVQEKLQDLLKVKYVLPVNNGTSACHLVAKVLHRKIKKYKSTILVPDNVYAAAWNSFLFDKSFYLTVIKPDLNTWNYDLDILEKVINSRTHVSVLIVHNIGNIMNVPELQKKFPKVDFVEDNCEGFLGQYNDQYSGTASFASSISFFGNKHITSGEGGAFITNNEDAYQFAKCIHSQGQSSKRFIHSELGYNYRMTNIQAAILYGQLEILPQILSMKQDVFDRYRDALKDRDNIFIQSEAPGTKHSNWMFGVRIPNSKGYDAAADFFEKHGIEIRPMFYPAYMHDHLKDNPDISLSLHLDSKFLNRDCFILPSYPELSIEEQNHILKVLEEYLEGIK